MFKVTQLHIDIARNATDDFNLFHDKARWNWLKNNPFNGTIALGFQLGLYVESQLTLTSDKKYTTFELNFVNPVKVNDNIELETKTPKESATNGCCTINQRFILKVNEKSGVLGSCKQSDEMTIQNVFKKYQPEKLSNFKDRTFIEDDIFLKRKWIIVSNVKNFLISCQADQTKYIDEFADKVVFPKMYPLSLISSALLERAKAIKHDLISSPEIYVKHKLCINNTQLKKMKSNDCLHILVKQVKSTEQDFSNVYVCGILNESSPLFVGELKLNSLQTLLDS